MYLLTSILLRPVFDVENLAFYQRRGNLGLKPRPQKITDLRLKSIMQKKRFRTKERESLSAVPIRGIQILLMILEGCNFNFKIVDFSEFNLYSLLQAILHHIHHISSFILEYKIGIKVHHVSKQQAFKCVCKANFSSLHVNVF